MRFDCHVHTRPSSIRYGDIEHFWVLDGNASLKECKDVSFFNCYNEDIFKILKKKCSKECAFEIN